MHERLPVPEQSPNTVDAANTEEPAGTRTVDHWRETSVSSGDTFARLLQDEGVTTGAISALAAAGKAGEALNRIYPGDLFRLGFNGDERLVRMIYRPSPDRTIRFERDGDGFAGHRIDEELQRRLEYVRGTINSSLFGSASAAGLSAPLTMDLVEIFRWDIDFIYGIRKGDRFMAVYETFYRDGHQVETGDIVAAEFVNRGQTYRAVRYERPDGSVDYYTPSGNSTRKAFVRTPVKFSRISSRYGRRDHPILNTSRMHYGVDFAAPRGTPIHATGDGRIVFRGRNGGFGNMVVLEHAGRYTTRYGHMARFARGQRVGSRVEQGDVIGYVGSTGLSTGPHVHYDFEIDGKHRNPLKVELPGGEPIPDDQLDRFRDQIRPLVAQLGTLDRAYAVNTR